jgi:hypothetical protein
MSKMATLEETMHGVFKSADHQEHIPAYIQNSG